MLCKHKVTGSIPVISTPGRPRVDNFMLILVLLFPLLGFISGSLFGRLMGVGISYITTLFTFFSFITSFTILCNIINTGNVYILKLTE
jgi:hypothetical protein